MKKGAPILPEAGSRGLTPIVARDEVTGALVDPGKPMVWRRTVPLAPYFELRQGEAVFGGMESSLATRFDAAGECLGRTLGLRFETGLFRGVRVTSALESEEAGPAFRGLSWGWGRIRTADEEVLRWRHAFTGLYSHVLIDAGGVELLRMRPTFLRFGRTETRLTLSGAAWSRGDVAELVLLTWFLRVHAEGRGRRVFKRSRKRQGSDFP